MRAHLGRTPLVAPTVAPTVAPAVAPAPASAGLARPTAPTGPAARIPDGAAGHVVVLKDGAAPRATASALAAHARLRYLSALNDFATRLATRLDTARLDDVTGGTTPRATAQPRPPRVLDRIDPTDTSDCDGHGTLAGGWATVGPLRAPHHHDRSRSSTRRTAL